MVVSKDDFDTLVLQIYRCVRNVPFAQFRDSALDIIRPALEFDAAKWGMGIHAERGTFISSAHLYRLPSSILDDYARAQKISGDTVAASIAAQFGRTVSESINDPVFEAAQSAAMCAYQRKYGLVHVLSTALPEPALGLGHFLSLFRSDPARPWTEASRRLKEQLFPHLIEAFMQARCLHMKQVSGTERGYVIANHALVIANITPFFRELMLLEWPDWMGNQMPPEVCAAWTGRPRSYYRGKHIVIGMEPDQQLVHLMVRRCNAIDVLSEQELAVARLFARGLEHKEIARENGVSPHTVRNQIKAIYFKLGVNNKTSLTTCLKDLQ